MTTPTPLNSFETGLLVELRQHVAERAADPRPKRPPVRRRVAFATSAAAAVALTVGGLALRPDAAAAFSVEQQSDGDVVVTITDMFSRASTRAVARPIGCVRSQVVDRSTTPS